MADLVHTAHSLKGMSANVSATRVQSVASEMESAARTGLADQCRDLESQLLAEIEACREEIGRLVSTTEAGLKPAT